MRIAVVELKEVDKTPQRLIDYFSPGRKQQVEQDNVSQMFGTMAGGDGYHLDGKSVVTIKPSDFNGIYMRSNPACMSAAPRYASSRLPEGIPEEVTTGSGKDEEDGEELEYEYDIQSEYTELTEKTEISNKKRCLPSSGKSVRSTRSARAPSVRSTNKAGVEDDKKVAASTKSVGGTSKSVAGTSKSVAASTKSVAATSPTKVATSVLKSPPSNLADSTMMTDN
jgi:hypothetical protein